MAGSTSPTSLFSNGSRNVYLEGVDLSSAAAGMNICAGGGNTEDIRLRHVKLPTSWSGAFILTAPTQFARAEMIACGNTGVNYKYRKKTNGGEVFDETTLVRTDGASNGTTPISYKCVSTSLARFPGVYVEGPELVKWNETVGTPFDVTVELLHDSVTALTNKEVFIEVQYFSEAGSPLGGKVYTHPIDFMATAAAIPSSSKVWTTTGMTNPNTQAITASITPQQAGYVHVRVFVTKPSYTVYFCPRLSEASGGGF